MKIMSFSIKNRVIRVISLKREKTMRYLKDRYLETLSQRYRLVKKPIPVIPIKKQICARENPASYYVKQNIMQSKKPSNTVQADNACYYFA
ncbi:MAG: hypothetical protein HN737_11405 [Desulfobacterales bacterium]|nr:hypothetical protein [Desulfobacterales bacterium]